MNEYYDLRRIVYGEDSPDGGKVFIPVCPQCCRFVKADKECYVNDDKKPNATCKKHGRVRMPDEGYI